MTKAQGIRIKKNANPSLILVTGTAGFIGSHVVSRLLNEGYKVVGIDNINDYYDVNLKKDRLAFFRDHPNYKHITADLADRKSINQCFETYRPSKVVHLAAQAGVRYAAENPHVYVSSNVTGTLHVLEGCRHFPVGHLVFASTSSVYGANTKMPFKEDQSTEHPLTLYAATKKASEMMAHSYAHLYGIPSTGLRFFTVYGPWGRPDMALFRFTKAILAGDPIQVFNHGRHSRSFTYIDDVVEGIFRILDRPARPDENWVGAKPNPATSNAPYRLYNIGSSTRVELLRYIEVIENCLDRKAKMQMRPLQPGDVPDTEADCEELYRTVGYTPKIDITDGVRRFVDWYLSYYEQK